MLFNTFEYAVFLALCVYFYYYFNVRGRLIFLLCASYFFYGVWSLKYSLLMAWISVWDNSVALLIASAPNPRRRRLILTLGVVGSVAVLVYFKYTNFLLDSLAATGSFLGHPIATYHLDIVLPLGVSFHTFQGMSYFIDVYRGNIQARKDVLPYFVYNSFFPQLVAGPIERAAHILPQLVREKGFHWVNIYRGVNLILWGLVKKVVFADNLAYYADTVFNAPEGRSSLELLLGVYAFAFQIFFDFSGYSDIAIGSGRCFGIRLSTNFNLPYLALDMRDYWQRWHISLSTWLRDYVYTSLAFCLPRRRRVPPVWIYFSLTATMVIGGLWHGANVTFLIWGAYHGALLCANHFLDQKFKLLKKITSSALLRVCSIVFTFHLVCVGYVFFRARNVVDAMTFFRGMSSLTALTVGHDLWGLIGWLIVILTGHIFYYLFGNRLPLVIAKPGPLKYAAYLVVTTLALLAFRGGASGKFIYFEF